MIVEQMVVSFLKTMNPPPLKGRPRGGLRNRKKEKTEFAPPCPGEALRRRTLFLHIHELFFSIFPDLLCYINKDVRTPQKALMDISR
jgi:hypothetical protein